MKVVDIMSDNKDKIRQLHAIEAIIADYSAGHSHYTHALKQLVHNGLSIQQAEQRLSNP